MLKKFERPWHKAYSQLEQLWLGSSCSFCCLTESLKLCRLCDG